MTFAYRHIALIGLGLIASSISLAARRAGFDGRITGTARTEGTRDTALRIGLCDAVFDTAAEAVAGADLVILCVPVGAMGAVAEEIAPHLAPGATVTDVGSVKGQVIAEVAPQMPQGVHFIPGHPLAGTEYSGPESGFASLFDNKWQLFTPIEGTDPVALERLIGFWQALGAKTDVMEPEHHDLVLAVTSSYAAPDRLHHGRRGRRPAPGDRAARSSSIPPRGFRDFTRIAASDPTMWRDVFLNNKAATLEILGRFTEELFALQRAIRTGDGQHLFDYFTRTRAIRRGIIDAGQDTAAPDFGRVPRKEG